MAPHSPTPLFGLHYSDDTGSELAASRCVVSVPDPQWIV
jgi:hypothetical protein